MGQEVGGGAEAEDHAQHVDKALPFPFDAGRAARVVGMNIVRHAINPDFLRNHVRPAFEAHFRSVLARRPQPNRGAGRHQMVLPLEQHSPILDFSMLIRLLRSSLTCSDCILSLLHRLTLPCLEPHIDYEPLFDNFLPLPPYCVYVHIPLVDLTPDNGPTEFWQGSPHMAISSVIPSLQEFGSLPIDALPSEKVLLNIGDVIIKDMRCFHRGTANTTLEARPMLSLIYSRKWYRLPYEKLYADEGYPPMRISKNVLDDMPVHLRSLLRFCGTTPNKENYDC